MKAIKCSQCGFVGFADRGFCKKCGWSLELSDHKTSPGVIKDGKQRSPTRFKLKLILALMILVAVGTGIVFAHYRLTKYFDKTPLYVAAINESKMFREPVTVRVNRKEIPSAGSLALSIRPQDKKAGNAVMAADVLEALGLIKMSVETNVRTVSLGTKENYGLYMGGTMISAPSSKEEFTDVKSDNLVIELTDSGRREAVNWKEADEPLSNGNAPLQSQYVLPWWIIPIGEREILKIESVTADSAQSDLETVLITFRWRWRPNKLGESFDLSSPAFQALPNKARLAATSLKMSSQSENYGLATLRKQYGRWECVEITFPSELLKN